MKPKKVISLLLVASMTLGTLPGCISAEEVNTPVGETENIIEIIDSKEYTSIEEYYTYLENLPSEDIQKVLTSPFDYTDEQVAKAAYDNLKENSVDINNEIIQTEFNNLLAYSMYPMGLTDEEYEFAVGNLGTTLANDQNPFVCYYPLAIAGHLITCKENHTTNEFGKTECPVILEWWNNLGNASVEDMLDSIYSENEAYQRIKVALRTSGLSINDYITELECLAYQAQNPDSIYNEELSQNLYWALNETLLSGENVYSVYIELAVGIHNTLFSEEPLEVPAYLKQAR